MADFYIRSWDPDSTYPVDPHEGDVCYTITLDQSWAPVAGVKNDNLVKEEVYENGEWKEVGGGGGDDLLTFGVGIEDDSGKFIVFYPYIIEKNGTTYSCVGTGNTSGSPYKNHADLVIYYVYLGNDGTPSLAGVEDVTEIIQQQYDSSTHVGAAMVHLIEGTGEYQGMAYLWLTATDG